MTNDENSALKGEDISPEKDGGKLKIPTEIFIPPFHSLFPKVFSKRLSKKVKAMNTRWRMIKSTSIMLAHYSMALNSTVVAIVMINLVLISAEVK